MTRHPGPAHLVLRGRTVELDPQLAVDHGPSGTGAPPISLPPAEKLGHPALQVFRIGNDLDLTGLFESLKSAEGREHFHLVIRALGLRPCQNALTCLVLQDAGPAAGTWIAKRRAIYDQTYGFHLHHLLLYD